MKRLFILLMASLVILSCKKEPLLNISTDSLILEASSGSRIITVQSNEPWTVSSDGDWINCAKRSGDASEEPISLTFYITDNSTGSERKSVITFSNGELTKKVNVTQKQRDAITTDIYSKILTSEAATFEVEVTANIGYSINVPSDAGWVKVDLTRALTSKKVYFNVEANTSENNRETEIAIQGTGGVSTTIRIVQKGIPSVLRYVHAMTSAFPPVIDGTLVEATIDWGDGETEAYSSSAGHVYTTEGEHTVTITGTGMTSFAFRSTTDIIEVDSSDF